MKQPVSPAVSFRDVALVSSYSGRGELFADAADFESSMFLEVFFYPYSYK